MTDRCPCPRCQSDRLGDYYAGLRPDKEWREWLLFSEHPSRDDWDVIQIASVLFLGSAGSPPREGCLTPQRAALIGDAFAFGALKYGRVVDWRNVPLDHHMQSAGRHFDAWLKDHASLDSESGLTHEAHFLARAVMIQEIRRTNGK